MRITQPKDEEPIRLLKTGRYRAVVDVSAKGERRRQKTATFDTIGRARDWVATTRADVLRGVYAAEPTEVSSETVEALCARWTASRQVRTVTVQGYGHVLRPVLRRIGSMKVVDLTAQDIDDLTAWLSREGGRRGQPLSPRSVRASLVALSQALDRAVRDDIVPRNVVKVTERPKVARKVGTALEHWQPEQLTAFVAHADGDPLAAAWRLTACGMTRADVLGLRWSDVDLDAGTVTVRQGRVALDRGDVVDEPKSAARARTVPVEVIWPGTVALLRSLKAAQASDRLAAGSAYSASGLVVVDALGRGVRPEWYSDRFRVVVKAAGLPTIRLHSVRHSLAFWLHHVKVVPADAAALLGHTVEVHLSTYLPDMGKAGIDRAADALAKAAAGS